MRSTILAMLASLTLAALMLPTAWGLNDEAQAAKEEGMRLYNAHQRSISTPFLEQAAEEGDVEAMYYLGEVNRLRHMGMNQAALEWYHQAAQHGDPHAMLRLFDGGACELGDVCPENGDDWPQAALELTLPKAEAGDPEAMNALYDIYYYVEDPDEDEAMKWLRRAVEAGHVESMHLLGEIARNDEEGYDNDTERLEAAEVWFRKAAEAGYAPSMNNLASVLNHLDQPAEAWEWITKASEAGHINGRGWLAACSIEPDGEGMNLCRAAPDPEPAKGWAILRAMNEEVPGTSSERLLRVYGENVTPEQREEGEHMKEEWLNLEPPLSYFPDKFGP
ncbi:tetratricopeptide repeat protein [Halomonas sp. SpR8]|uniref:tetratricopeptide repeat protein n=1 Tax=Halomonas sp. SpR8 TaxID=3050463 RepID=UPI0027E4A46A|nr:tetratricopeptide repeat protein [Halomonas sp. SpR8]MDQ7729784.1 tetratricopeptide repeat protein [Halomonas sp. SpR8]